jgi:hypothetical protein
MIPKDSVMAKKITVTGKPARRIEVSGKPQRRIESAEFANALHAEPIGPTHALQLDPISLASLGNELIKRLRSSGGRPALLDATEICRVPLSANDIEALEKMTDEIAQSTGTKPSPGQVASIVVREYLCAATKKGALPATVAPNRAQWPQDWNGDREKYRAAQNLIQIAKSTWGRKDAA